MINMNTDQGLNQICNGRLKIIIINEVVTLNHFPSFPTTCIMKHMSNKIYYFVTDLSVKFLVVKKNTQKPQSCGLRYKCVTMNLAKNNVKPQEKISRGTPISLAKKLLGI